MASPAHVSTLRYFGCSVLLGLALTGPGCGSAPATRAAAAPGRPNIILISIDCLRADHLGCHGYSRPTSAAIDALAADGVLFENAVAPAPWTLPSHITLLTSLYSRTHQATGGGRRVAPGTPTLASLLKAAGYRTHAVVSGPYLQRRYGYAEGFDIYDDDLLLGPYRRNAVNSPDVNERAIRALDGPRPFFLFLHYWDVHHDYAPPPPFDTRFDPDYPPAPDGSRYIPFGRINEHISPRDLRHVIALYDGEIAWVDEHVGRLVAELKHRALYDNTIIVLTADHGEGFYEHGQKGHEHTLYEELLHVPLIVRAPGLTPGRRIATRVQNMDVMPTLLEAVGAPVPSTVQGRSLWAGLRGAPLEDRPVFAETTRARRSRGDRRCEAWCVYDGPFKLIVYANDQHPPELFDLRADPAEKHNLYGSGPTAALRAKLEEWLERTPVGNVTRHEGLDPATRQQLKALGYLGGENDEGDEIEDEEGGP